MDALTSLDHRLSETKTAICPAMAEPAEVEAFEEPHKDLEDEFKKLLSLYSKPVEPDRLFECLPNSMLPSSWLCEHQPDLASKGQDDSEISENASYIPLILIPPEVLPLLHDLAQQMVQAGHCQQVLKIHRDTRSSYLEQSLQIFGEEKLSKEDVQKMQWDVLEPEIGKWIRFMWIAVKFLFPGEQIICDQIYKDLDSLSEQSFADVTSTSFELLLSFGDAAAKKKRSPDKLFALLDMYEIMRELRSEIESVFAGKVCAEIRDATVGLTKGLAQSVLETFDDFEEVENQNHSSPRDSTAESVHPLTRQVLNYMRNLLMYESTLKQVLQEFTPAQDINSQYMSWIVRILQHVQVNLDKMSKQYKDPALKHLFLMNNFHYIAKWAQRTEAKDVLGDDWFQRHRRLVEENILKSLSAEGLMSSCAVERSGGASRTVIEDRLETFNKEFEELHQIQSQWTVPDFELRKSLIDSVTETLIPSYRSFVKHLGENAHKYIKYTPEDLKRMLDDLF